MKFSVRIQFQQNPSFNDFQHITNFAIQNFKPFKNLN